MRLKMGIAYSCAFRASLRSPIHPVEMGSKSSSRALNRPLGNEKSQKLNELTYKRWGDWFVYLNQRVKPGCPSPAQIALLAEAKATRELLVHNRGVTNSTYPAKAGPQARCADGVRIQVPEPYHWKTWELFRGVVADMSAAAIAKVR